jgi:hypothetical protein
MQNVQKNLGPDPIPSPAEETCEPLDVSKLVDTAPGFEAQAHALVVCSARLERVA